MGKKTTILKVYKSYSFVDKDPVIDIVHSAVVTSTKSYSKIHELGGPAPSTLYNWFDGKTKRPQGCTLAATMLGIGGDVIYKSPSGIETSLRRYTTPIEAKVEQAKPVKQKKTKADKIRALLDVGYSIQRVKRKLRVGQNTIYKAIAGEDYATEGCEG